MKKLSEKLENIDFISYGGKVLGALALLLIGLYIIKLLVKGAKLVMKKRGLEESLQNFLSSLINWGLKVFLFVAIAGQLGIETTSFAAVIAAASLALGMALQGSLSNFAGGVLLMIFKPFKIGDYIEAQGLQGTVKTIEIFTTKLNTIDNKEIIIPNGILSNGNIINYSAEKKRRVDITFGVSYDADIKETKSILMNVLKNTPQALNEPSPTVLLGELADSSVNFITRTWVKTEDYWDAYFHIMENTKIALDEAKIEIPYPHSVEIRKSI